MVSVIIPTYNEEQSISDCLQSLVNQKTSLEFEVIVVNNNSTDNTINVVNKYKDKLNLRIVNQLVKGRGAARQKGFEIAREDILLSTDADALVPPLWIEKLSNSLKENNVVAVTGICKITDCGLVTNAIFNFLQPMFMRIYRLVFGHYFLSGFSFAIYKETYIKSGGFNKKLNAQEDVDLSFRVSRLGKIKFIPNLAVVSSGRRFNKGLFKGLIPYVKTFISYFFFKDKEVILQDIR